MVKQSAPSPEQAGLTGRVSYSSGQRGHYPPMLCFLAQETSTTRTATVVGRYNKSLPRKHFVPKLRPHPRIYNKYSVLKGTYISLFHHLSFACAKLYNKLLLILQIYTPEGVHLMSDLLKSLYPSYLNPQVFIP